MHFTATEEYRYYYFCKWVKCLKITRGVGRDIFRMRNHSHMVIDTHLSEDECLISFDVTSLYTNVPVHEAIEVCCDLLFKRFVMPKCADILNHHEKIFF